MDLPGVPNPPAQNPAANPPAAQPPAQNTPAANPPAAQNPPAGQPPAQNTPAANPRPGQTTAAPATTAKPGEPPKTDAKASASASGSSAAKTDAKSSSSASKSESKSEPKDAKSSDNEDKEKNTSLDAPTGTVTKVKEVTAMSAPPGQKQGQYLTIFPADFPVEKWKPTAEKSVGKGYLFFQNQLGDNMMLFAAVLAVMALFMALLLCITGWAESKTDSYLPTEARWADGDKLRKRGPRQVQPGILPNPRGDPRGARGAARGREAPLPPLPFNARGGAGPGPSARGPPRRPPGPPLYEADHPAYALQPLYGARGFAPTPAGGGRGYSQPVVRGQGYAPAPQLRRLPSQNQHGW